MVACIDQAKAIWLRGGAGIPGKLTHETIHATAATLFIQINRESFNLGEFAGPYGESEGLKTLRLLMERVKSEPHLELVRDGFGEELDSIPGTAAGQRQLYAQLKAAVDTQTQVAAQGTTPTEDDDTAEASEEFPPDNDLPASLGGDESLSPELQQIADLATKVYGSATDAKFREFLDRVTRKKGATIADLSEAQGKAVMRSLESFADSKQPAA